MHISDKNLIYKKSIKKKRSQDFAIKTKIWLQNNVDDKDMIKRMERQIRCLNRIDEYENGKLQSYYCGQKTCEICNNIRLTKHLKKYLPILEKDKYQYNITLTVKNPYKDKLKYTIDKMFKFFDNSGLKKDKEFRFAKKYVKMIRSFECTFNTKNKTYNVHFHILTSGNIENSIKSYNKKLISYWLDYFPDITDSQAQYCQPVRESVLENFKYVTKFNTITDKNIEMFYNLLLAIYRKRVFSAIGFNKEQVKENIKEQNNNEKVEKLEYKKSYLLAKNDKNEIIYHDKQGVILNDEITEKAYKKYLEERKNLRDLKKYFRNKKAI